MSERDFRCEKCGNKTRGTAQPYQCSICGSENFHYMTSAKTLHKKLWEI
jgi:rubrerythrin